jgi:hypothetical protein
VVVVVIVMVVFVMVLVWRDDGVSHAAITVSAAAVTVCAAAVEVVRRLMVPYNLPVERYRFPQAD